MVDKNLFLHDLAVVAIMKCEGPYLKEWLDYHLLAGVDHFYIYDNESPDNQAEVAKPYVEAGLVDYFPLPGKMVQMSAYNDAVKRFKFFSRYMAFIDGDEFIYPKSNRAISEGVDEILSHNKNAAGLAINWQLFGSNNLETADYSKGVLERFTRRAPRGWSARIPSGIFGGNINVKTLANPRAINLVFQPHYPKYFEGLFSVNETGKIVQGHDNNPVTAEKIILNHYYTKSLEEFTLKQNRGRSDILNRYGNDWYDVYNRNDEFDDGILKYRAAREKNFFLEDITDKLNRVTDALAENLSAYASGEKLSLETALTCLALSTYLREKFPTDAEEWEICEKTSLLALRRSLNGINLVDARLFLRELPKILALPYPVVKDIRRAALSLIPKMMNFFRMNSMWRDYVELNYIQDLLKLGG